MKHLSKVLIIVLALALAVCALAVFVFADENAQARIGDTEYATFGDAWAAAKSGDTITLLEDVTGNGYTLTGEEGSTKSITIDLNGKVINAQKCFIKLYDYTELSIIGAGVLHGKETSIFETNDDAKTVLNIGDGENTVYIDDANATGSMGGIIKMRGGELNLSKVVIEVIKGTGATVLYTNGSEVAINVIDSSITTYTSGSSKIAQFDKQGGVVKFYAKNSTFDQKTTVADMGNATTQAGKAAMFNMCSDNAANSQPGPGEGSFITMDDCIVRYKWRGFVGNGSANTDICPGMTVNLNRCEIQPGAGNGMNNPDTAIFRRMTVTLTDCMFDDVYMRGNVGEFIAMNGTVNFKGSVRTKYNKMMILSNTNGGATGNNVTVDWITKDGEGKDNALQWVYLRDTGDQYHWTQLCEDQIDVSKIVSAEQISYNPFELKSLQIAARTSAGMSKIDYGLGHIDINCKAGTKDSSKMVANGATVPTLNGSNYYLRFYSEQDPQTIGSTDAYIDFYLSKSANNHPFNLYQYYTFDMDIMTDQAYQDGMTCNLIGRPVGGGSPCLSNNQAFQIKTETSGEHKGESYVMLGSNRVYIGAEAYLWHHITVILRVLSDDNVLTNGECTMLVYVDGKYLNQASVGANSSGCGYFNALRFTYAGSTKANADDAICFDNIMVNAYRKMTDENYVDPFAPIYANTALTLQEADYMNFGANYVFPEVAPIAQVDGINFQTFTEAYAYAAPSQKNITLLRNTKEVIDIQTNIVINTNGIDWVPTDNSWGFERRGEGTATQYVFSSALNAGADVYWYSNPFDTDYAYIQNVKGGRYIAHPYADVNFDLIQNYGVKNEDGSYTFYKFVGWATTEGATEANATFPIITGENMDDNFSFYPVYEEVNPLYMLDAETITLWAAGESFGDADVQKSYEIYPCGFTASDLRETFASLKSGTVTLMDDILDRYNATYLTSGNGSNITFDLNGHKLVNLAPKKQRIINAGEGATLTVTSSKPGAVIEGRMLQEGTGYVNQCTGLFTATEGCTLNVIGENLTLRGGIILESDTNVHFTANFEGFTFEQNVGDSWAIFMIRTRVPATVNIKGVTVVSTAYDLLGVYNASYPGTTEGAKDDNGNVPAGKAGTGYAKPLLDVGGGAQTVDNVVINVEDTIITVPWSNGTPAYIIARLPEGTTLNVKGTKGNYSLGSANPYGGVIIAGAGNQYGNYVNPTSNNYKMVQFAEGVAEARQWGEVGKLIGMSYTYLDAYQLSASYLDYVNLVERTFKLDSSFKIRYGTYAEGEYRPVEWHLTTDPESQLLHRENWANFEAGPYYNNNVPSNSDAEGFTYNYPRDAWAMFAQIDGVDYYAPDPAKAMLVSIPYIKESITLYADFGLNIYVPKSTSKTTVKVGDLVLPLTERTVDGREYYVARYAVASDKAAEEIALEIVFSGSYLENNKTEEFSNSQNFTVSVAKYIEALATYEDGAYADLAAAMLRYAKAAFLYTAEEGTELPEALAADEAAEHAEAGEIVSEVKDNSVVAGVSIALAEKPVYVLKLAEGIEGEHEIAIRYTGESGRVYLVKKAVSAEDTTVQLDSMKLFDFDKTITVTVDGEVVATYNFEAYAQAQEDAKASAVVVALRDYIEAAKAYCFGI